MNTQAIPTFRLLYVSDAVPSCLGEDEATLHASLTRLQTQAHSANQRLSVRGKLIHGGGHFMQWLEGEESTVRALMKRIETDPRHARVQVLCEGQGPPLLEAWSMGLLSHVDRHRNVSALIERLRESGATALGLEQTADPAALMHSMLLMPTFTSVDPLRRRVGVFGQTGVWTAALLSHLSAQTDRPVRRTRILSNERFDREALLEHVDLQSGGESYRIVHFSSGLLAPDWRASALQPIDLAALFFSGTTKDSALEFARAVVRQLGPLNATTPVSCLFSRTAAPVAEQVQAALVSDGRHVDITVVPLADSDAVWQVIRGSVPARKAAAPSPPACDAAKPIEPVRLDETLTPAVEDHVESPRDLSAAGRAWLDSMLSIEGVETAVLVANDGSRQGLASVRSDAESQRLRIAEALMDVALHRRVGLGMRREPAREVLTRTQDRFTILRPLDDNNNSDEVLVVFGEPGYRFEALLRRGLDDRLTVAPVGRFAGL